MPIREKISTSKSSQQIVDMILIKVKRLGILTFLDPPSV